MRGELPGMRVTLFHLRLLRNHRLKFFAGLVLFSCAIISIKSFSLVLCDWLRRIRIPGSAHCSQTVGTISLLVINSSHRISQCTSGAVTKVMIRFSRLTCFSMRQVYAASLQKFEFPSFLVRLFAFLFCVVCFRAFLERYMILL